MTDLCDLGTSCEVAAKARKKYVGHALTILVKEVVARELPEVRVVIHPAAGLVVVKSRWKSDRRKQAVTRIAGGNELQEICGRDRNRTGRNLSSWKYTWH